MDRTNSVVLKVDELETHFRTDEGEVKVLDSVSFDVHAGKTLGIVGESGCGKSVTALSILRLLPRPYGRVTAGQVIFKDQNILELDSARLYKIRGNRISMIFQDPMTALNPVQTVRRQLFEVLELHRTDLAAKDREGYAIEMLKKVGIPAPEVRLNEYPHQLSGGMRQRVMIAIALACKPDILIADEPTTALDVTIQAQILDLMRELQQETQMAIIFITHDLGVVAEMCDEVVVMYAGRVVEQGSVFDIFDKAKHPYTKGLHASIPHLNTQSKSVLPTIEGVVPSLADMPQGCRFRNRCQFETEVCKQTPKLEHAGQQVVACWHWRDIRDAD